ncbi:thioredoxin-like protein [Halteromyces radiatus]|uniref:thioredoxin-like protein n=1 Tax=Halteromyces radiatus TaxID=101107 RepID=UPI00222073FA|nr:thioredoxin-like protein [Halteromyces radiatus]KAI8085194.1 thioredoxin-like protein [Halteromyces radiatus]
MVNKTILWSAIAASFASISNVLASDSDVLALTDKTFNKEVLDKSLMLVEFYAPWCGHCKALAPEYELAATDLKDKIPLAKVDCTENEATCREHGVQGYPTLKVFRNGESTEYRGTRKHEGIVSYMKKQALPNVSDLTEATALNDFKESDRVVVIAYVKPDDKETKETYDTLAAKLRDDFTFGLVTDEELAKTEQIKEFPSLVLYKQFDEKRVDLSGAALKDEDLTNFIKSNSIPLLDQIDAENFATYMESGLLLGYAFTDNEDDRAKYDALLRPVAEKFKGKVNLVHIDASKYGGHTSNVGLKDGEFPAFAIQNLNTASKYPYTGSDVSTTAFEEFVENVFSGKIEPTLNSEEVPETNDGPVKVVVGSQFNDIVLDKSKDVFLEVYAPWCGHCKNLAPTWEKLGEQVQGLKNSNLVIAKLDGTANDIPPEGDFKVEGFPTLKFFKAETNEMIDYNGDRSHADLIRFIKEHSTGKIELEVPVEEEQEEQKEAKDEAETVNHDEL